MRVSIDKKKKDSKIHHRQLSKKKEQKATDKEKAYRLN
jgi:hypothetical protein